MKAESITVAISNTRHENCLIVGLNYEILVEGCGVVLFEMLKKRQILRKVC